MSSQEFLFSIVMPVYNVEQYISNSIDSLIRQTVGFKENVQLILVDDESTDGSGKICEKYQKAYPENIKYIKKENGGASSARNAGIPFARGAYIGFLDPDDYFSDDALLFVKRFFDEHDGLKIATCRMISFEASSQKHHLDYCFKKTRIIDIHDSYVYPVLSAAKSFFSRDIVINRKFDERVTIAEDVLFINELVMDEGKYGVVREAEYHYRKRLDKSSLSDNSRLTDSFYIDTPKYVYNGLLDYSVRKYGEIIPYIQYVIITDLRWRLFDNDISDSLSPEMSQEYRNKLCELLSVIDDSVIIRQHGMDISQKMYALRLKHKFKCDEVPADSIKKLAKRITLDARILNAENEYIYIYGKSNEKSVDDSLFVQAEDNKGNTYKADYEKARMFDRTGIDDDINIDGYVYTIMLPLKSDIEYTFCLTDGCDYKRKLQVNYGKFSRITNLNDSFFICGKFIVMREDDKLAVLKNSLFTRTAAAKNYEKELRKYITQDELKIRRDGAVIKARSKKPIWLVSDRSYVAGDNGEAFFRFLEETDARNKYDIYFLIEENSDDFDRMSKYGRTVEFGSREHLVMQIAASKIISSQMDKWVMNPFKDNLKYYRDLLDYKYVFLQHGIIKDDMSSVLNKYKKNIAMFVTSSKEEYNSIVHGDYGYKENEVKLTGLARYDRLVSSPEKLIAVIPTWRSYIASGITDWDSHRKYNKDFKQSDYYLFYEKLINDDRLISVMRENNYKGCFYLHPSFAEQAVDFDGNDTVSVYRGNPDFNKIMKESALLVTDYSSIAFDFAYLKKPIIYAQFDREKFFSGHSYKKGYFDYNKDGFGSVCEDYDETVSSIIKAIDADCKNPEIFIKRSEQFFAFHDKENCKRILEAIETL